MSCYAIYHRKIIKRQNCIISLKQRQECKSITAGKRKREGKTVRENQMGNYEGNLRWHASQKRRQ